MTDENPGLASKWSVDPSKGLLIDDEVFPYWVAAEPGPMVEEIDENLHILWLPVLMDGPVAKYGRPTGKRIEAQS